MIALHVPRRVVSMSRRAQLETILLTNLTRATPSALPGGDGLTVDVLLRQYDQLAERGLVPSREQTLAEHPELRREFEERRAG